MPGNDDELSRPILQEEDGNGGRSDSDNELDEQLTGCGATSCCNPSSTCHRFLALILMCLVGFGKLHLFHPIYIILPGTIMVKTVPNDNEIDQHVGIGTGHDLE